MARRKRPTPRTTRPRRRRLRNAAPPPNLDVTLASALGGGGGAVLGGVLANKGWDPTTIAIAMTLGGGVGAYMLDGNARIAANGLAAAGAGQLALSLLAKNALDEPAKPAADTAKVAAAGKKARDAYLPHGSIESAFERARHRLAMEDEPERFVDIVEVPA